MINDTPTSPKARTQQEVQPASKPAYRGTFHLKSTSEGDKNKANKRSSSQTFTFG